MRASTRLLAAGAALALTLTACGGSSDSAGNADPTATDATATEDGGGSGGPVTVASFNFPESVILMEIYAQALADAGISVQREARLGTRELVFPELTGGSIDVVPEYVGGALSSGFGEDPAGNTEEAVQQLRDLFSEEGVAVLEPAEASNRDVFVVTSEYAETHGLTAIGDLADAGDVTVAGPPECQDRATCFAGLQDVYGLENLTFTTIQEKSPRLAALRNGDVQVITLFSTDPVFTDGSLVALEDPQDMTPPQNVVPVVTESSLEANPQVEDVLNEVSATLTTEGLTELNAQAAEGQQPADVAAGWLEENGLLGG